MSLNVITDGAASQISFIMQSLSDFVSNEEGCALLPLKLRLS